MAGLYDGTTGLARGTGLMAGTGLSTGSGLMPSFGSAGTTGDGGLGSFIWPPWLFTKANILPNADDHSGWTGAAGITGTQADRDGGTTAEEWVEHVGVANGRSLQKNAISAPTGRYICQLFYKQVAGSAAARRLGITVMTATTGTNGAYVIVDETGVINDSGEFGDWTFHSGSVSLYGNGFYEASFEFTTTDASIQMFLRQRDDSGINYNGDGASGWYLDDNAIFLA